MGVKCWVMGGECWVLMICGDVVMGVECWVLMICGNGVMGVECWVVMICGDGVMEVKHILLLWLNNNLEVVNLWCYTLFDVIPIRVNQL